MQVKELWKLEVSFNFNEPTPGEATAPERREYSVVAETMEDAIRALRLEATEIGLQFNTFDKTLCRVKSMTTIKVSYAGSVRIAP